MPKTFNDTQLSLHLAGFPNLRWLEDRGLVLSDWSGSLLNVDPSSGRVIGRANAKDPTFPVGQTLTSLCSAPGPPGRCAVATRAGWACVWTPAEDRLLKIIPQGGGPVNSVALSQDGTELLMGTGYYSLSGRDSVGRVERWTLDPEPTFQAGKSLVGTAVDCLDWNTDEGTIAVLLGVASQDRGYLVLLDETHLDIRDIFATDSCRYLAARILPEEERVLMVHPEGVELRELSEFTFRKRGPSFSAQLSGAQISESGHHVLLSNGLLYSVLSDETTELPSLPNVAATAFGPPGVIYGVTLDGILRTWRVATDESDDWGRTVWG